MKIKTRKICLALKSKGFEQEEITNEQFKTDMECFTLAYVMDRKFKKYWDGVMAREERHEKRKESE